MAKVLQAAGVLPGPSVSCWRLQETGRQFFQLKQAVDENFRDVNGHINDLRRQSSGMEDWLVQIDDLSYDLRRNMNGKFRNTTDYINNLRNRLVALEELLESFGLRIEEAGIGNN